MESISLPLEEDEGFQIVSVGFSKFQTEIIIH